MIKKPGWYMLISLSNYQSDNERWVKKQIAAVPIGTENGGGLAFVVNAVLSNIFCTFWYEH